MESGFKRRLSRRDRTMQHTYKLCCIPAFAALNLDCTMKTNRALNENPTYFFVETLTSECQLIARKNQETPVSQSRWSCFKLTSSSIVQTVKDLLNMKVDKSKRMKSLSDFFCNPDCTVNKETFKESLEAKQIQALLLKALRKSQYDEFLIIVKRWNLIDVVMSLNGRNVIADVMEALTKSRKHDLDFTKTEEILRELSYRICWTDIRDKMTNAKASIVTLMSDKKLKNTARFYQFKFNYNRMIDSLARGQPCAPEQE